MKIDHLIFLLIATVSLVFVAFILTGCKSEDWHTLDVIQGHNAEGATVTENVIVAPDSSVEALVLSSQIVSSSSSASSSSSSSEYVAPLTEACLPGEKAFRLWDCDSTGHRAYW